MNVLTGPPTAGGFQARTTVLCDARIPTLQALAAKKGPARTLPVESSPRAVLATQEELETASRAVQTFWSWLSLAIGTFYGHWTVAGPRTREHGELYPGCTEQRQGDPFPPLIRRQRPRSFQGGRFELRVGEITRRYGRCVTRRIGPFRCASASAKAGHERQDLQWSPRRQLGSAFRRPVGCSPRRQLGSASRPVGWRCRRVPGW
jgi:hypothetical protein